MAGIVVVFDFDKTIVDCDSDNWAVDELGFNNLFNHLLPTMPWNTLMDRMMMEFHSHGKTIEDIVQVLQRIPIHPRIIPAIKAAHALGCDLRIVSDANTFFIETILKHLKIRECFSEINTNPSYINEDGRLQILPYHDFNKLPHGCTLCPPNMCKGEIIEKIQESLGENNRLIYLGDGSGDYCPSLRLKEKDFVMPRKNFPVWELICKDPLLIKAQIHEWSNGEELERISLQLINKICSGESAELISPNCNLHIMVIIERIQNSISPEESEIHLSWSGDYCLSKLGAERENLLCQGRRFWLLKLKFMNGVMGKNVIMMQLINQISLEEKMLKSFHLIASFTICLCSPDFFLKFLHF